MSKGLKTDDIKKGRGKGREECALIHSLWKPSLATYAPGTSVVKDEQTREDRKIKPTSEALFPMVVQVREPTLEGVQILTTTIQTKGVKAHRQNDTAPNPASTFFS